MASSLEFSPDGQLDLFNQTVSLLSPDGTVFTITTLDIDTFTFYNVKICINYSAQLGASFMLLVMLLLLTKPDKRRSPVFFLNTTALGLNTIRSLLQCLYFTGPFSEVYSFFSGDVSRVPASQYAISVTGVVLTLLLLVCIEVSLILQTNVVCSTLTDGYRRAVMVVSAIIALIAIGFRFGLMVENSKAIVNAELFYNFIWLSSAANITTTISIFYFCIVFVGKLGVALVARRKLGLRQFGPMQVIFIMGCQTLIIPAIFSILQYCTDIPEMASNVLTLVAIFLPLSSIWASSATPTAPGLHDGNQRDGPFRLLGSFASGTPQAFRASKNSSDTPSKTHIALGSPFSNRSNQMDDDLEAQGSIRVDRMFSVASLKDPIEDR